MSIILKANLENMVLPRDSISSSEESKRASMLDSMGASEADIFANFIPVAGALKAKAEPITTTAHTDKVEAKYSKIAVEQPWGTTDQWLGKNDGFDMQETGAVITSVSQLDYSKEPRATIAPVSATAIKEAEVDLSKRIYSNEPQPVFPQTADAELISKPKHTQTGYTKAIAKNFQPQPTISDGAGIIPLHELYTSEFYQSAKVEARHDFHLMPADGTTDGLPENQVMGEVVAWASTGNKNEGTLKQPVGFPATSIPTATDLTNTSPNAHLTSVVPQTASRDLIGNTQESHDMVQNDIGMVSSGEQRTDPSTAWKSEVSTLSSRVFGKNHFETMRSEKLSPPSGESPQQPHLDDVWLSPISTPKKPDFGQWSVKLSNAPVSLPVVEAEAMIKEFASNAIQDISAAGPSHDIRSSSHSSLQNAASVPSTLSDPSNQKLSQNISTQITAAVQDRKGQDIEIRLDPEELGRVRIILSTKEGGLHVFISAERPETLDLIRKNAEDLSSHFSEAGFDSTNLNFDQGGFENDDPHEMPSTLVESNAASTHDLTDGPAGPVLPDGLDIRL